MDHHSAKGGTILNYLLQPITPLATAAPELPLTCESGWLLRPRSSSCPHTTTDLPRIEFSPKRESCLSARHMQALPKGSACRLPRSPACRSSPKGLPCFLPRGLKCVPVELTPCEKSPNSWTCTACLPLGLSPLTEQAMLTGESAAPWLKETSPLTEVSRGQRMQMA